MIEKFWKEEGYKTAIKNLTEEISYIMTIPAHDTILTRRIIDNLITLRKAYQAEAKEKGFNISIEEYQKMFPLKNNF
ncbi:MAG: hypothetical protein PHT02_01315 [Tissierellia bacterium]|nr:hypothetical protein [Tissierellia bacterium]